MSSRPEAQETIDEREREFFSGYYAEQRYNPTAWRLRMQRELRSVLREHGSERLGRVLSVGCGDGRFELMLAPFADRVLGIDLSPQAVELARRLSRERGVDNVEFRCASVTDFDTPERFDTVLCIAFLHHVPAGRLRELMARLVDRIEPGGLLYTQDPNVRGILRRIGRAVLGGAYDRYHSPDERELDPREMKRTLRDLGLTNARTAGIDVTVLPLGYVLARGPGWPLRICAWIDRLWCATPLERWASGFMASARKPE